jgi:hypothetical protein
MSVYANAFVITRPCEMNRAFMSIIIDKVVSTAALVA